MLVLSSSLKLVALAASLLASMPLASADLRQGPTGIEHVKRFQPSTAANPCPYVCPTYVSTAQQVQSGAPATLEPYKIAGAPVSGSTTQTLCQYSFGLNTPVNGIYNCIYGKADGEERLVSGAPGCPATASRTPGCAVRRRSRTLSPLEQVVRSRQYNPKRRSDKRQ